jgi:mono/diheme cytochrome c family protein
MRARLIPLAASFAGVLIAGAALAEPDGAGLFQQNCSACHQAHGEGVKGAFPALAGDTFVQGDKAVVAALLLHGRGGMPNFSDDLSDAEIAAVLTYVRSAWGNNAPPIDVATVTAARARAAAAVKDPSVLATH